jgi:hypothetical protein
MICYIVLDASEGEVLGCFSCGVDAAEFAKKFSYTIVHEQRLNTGIDPDDHYISRTATREPSLVPVAGLPNKTVDRE